MQVVRRSVTVAVGALLVGALALVGAVGSSGPAAAVGQPEPSANQLFAQQLYLDFYGRPGSTGEVDDLAATLDAQQITRLEAGIGSARSYAYAQLLVDGFYRNTLGRDPDLDGQAYWTGEIWNERRSVAEVAAQIYASPEWFDSVGGTDTAWVTALYDRLLHRLPDGPGLAYWTQRAQTDGRAVVAIVFYQTDESLRARTTALYALLLGRAPDPDGLTFWAAQVLARGDRTVAGMLAGSDEYFQRATGGPPAASSAPAAPPAGGTMARG